MRRYRFRLDPVLRVRRIEQDSAQAAMAAAGHELAVADEALHRSVDRYRTLSAADGPQPAAAWLVARDCGGRSAATVVAAGTARELAAGQVAERRDALRDARVRVAALERLDERRRGEHAHEAQREDEARIDELVTGRHGRQP
jgi:flagellar FliJ protein